MDGRRAGTLLFAASIAVTLVTTVDLAILWTPLRFGTAGWEFATITRTMTSMPVIVVALILAAFGLIVWPGSSARRMRGLAAMMAVMALAIVGAGVLYGLSVPVVLGRVDAESADAARRAITKTATEMVIYPVALGVMARAAWRYGSG